MSDPNGSVAVGSGVSSRSGAFNWEAALGNSHKDDGDGQRHG